MFTARSLSAQQLEARCHHACKGAVQIAITGNMLLDFTGINFSPWQLLPAIFRLLIMWTQACMLIALRQSAWCSEGIPVTVSLTSSAVLAEGRNASAACSIGVWQKLPCTAGANIASVRPQAHPSLAPQAPSESSILCHLLHWRLKEPALHSNRRQISCLQPQAPFLSALGASGTSKSSALCPLLHWRLPEAALHSRRQIAEYVRNRPLCKSLRTLDSSSNFQKQAEHCQETHGVSSAPEVQIESTLCAAITTCICFSCT